MTVLSVKASRVEAAGGPTPLELQDPAAGLRVARLRGASGVDPGDERVRHEWVRSHVLEGAVPVSSLADIQQARLDVFAEHPTAVGLRNLVGVVRTAFRQRTFTLTVDVDGATFVWACFRADVSSPIDLAYVHQRHATVSLSIPRQPEPITGPF